MEKPKAEQKGKVMRKFGKIDANHREIVEALRQAGASVQSLAAVGRGCPDLLVGFRGKNFLMEVKDGEKPPSKRRLTDDERMWMALWSGVVYTVISKEEALAVLR